MIANSKFFKVGMNPSLVIFIWQNNLGSDKLNYSESNLSKMAKSWHGFHLNEINYCFILVPVKILNNKRYQMTTFETNGQCAGVYYCVVPLFSILFVSPIEQNVWFTV